MKQRTIALAALTALAFNCVCSFAHAQQTPVRGLREVDNARVQVSNGFWGRRLETHHRTTVGHALDCLERAGHVTNFDLAAGVSDEPLHGHHAFDSDLHKALEGALYLLEHFDNKELLRRVDAICDRILAAQQDDGFLISYYIVRDTEKRWETLRLEHQLYNAGHLFEMAVAHHRLTGETKLLDAARRFADLIDSVFGPGKRYDVGGHEEIELALVKLYRATGDRRYLLLSRFFLDERGHAHGMERGPFNPGTTTPETPTFDDLPDAERKRAQRRARNSIRNGRMQDHKPLVDQREAVGHAVRAGYVYSAMTDIVRFMDDTSDEKALDHLWRDVVGRKMYVTGSVGTAQYHDEGFGDPYLLPNETAYCESCASIAHVLWQHRMNLLHGDAKYADVMELALYNGVLAGISISGDAFFYGSPMASRRGSKRPSWIGLACCPTNLTRVIPQVGGLAYACDARRLYANLYLSGTASVALTERVNVQLIQETDYPWDGQVRMTVTPNQPAQFTLCLRIPGWARTGPAPSDLYRFANPEFPHVALQVNGEPVESSPRDDGYVHIERDWRAGDIVELSLPMPARRVIAHDNVEAARDKVALMRGPIVYCLESADQPAVDVFEVLLPREASLSAVHRPDLLGGVTVLQTLDRDSPDTTAKLTAIPYYAWANRERLPMTVWINEPHE